MAKDTGARVVGGKFHSTGVKEDVAANTALVCRLVGEIGVDGYELVAERDRPFIDDVRFKLQSGGSSAVFGWRQVEAVVRVHGEVEAKRAATAD